MTRWIITQTNRSCVLIKCFYLMRVFILRFNTRFHKPCIMWWATIPAGCRGVALMPGLGGLQADPTATGAPLGQPAHVCPCLAGACTRSFCLSRALMMLPGCYYISYFLMLKQGWIFKKKITTILLWGFFHIKLHLIFISHFFSIN